MNTRSPRFLNKSHNFGIFLKKEKRGVLQLDFPSRMILMIQRGHIKKTHSFHSLLYFESEEDLHISLRFLDGDLEFDADNMEEKHTICRLLDLILETENAETPDVLAGGVCVLPQIPIVPHNVLKDGVLEKKGNTTITTWNRRRVKISAGEFSYFKPGEELALNVVQLRRDRCGVRRVGQNSIQLMVNQRIYCFRVPNDSKSGLNVETVRDDWIKAFDQAMTMKRAISSLSTASEDSADDAQEPGHEEGMSDVGSEATSPFLSHKTYPDSCGESSDGSKPEITASVSVHFSYNNNNKAPSSAKDPTTTTTFINTQTTKPAKRGTVYPFRRQKNKGSDRNGGSSDVVSRPHPDSISDDLPVTALRARFTAHSPFDKDPTQLRTASLRESKAKALNDRVLAFSDLTHGESDPKILARRELSCEDVPKATRQAMPVVEPLQPKNCGKIRPSVLDLWKEPPSLHNKPSHGQVLVDKSYCRGSKVFTDDCLLDARKRSGDGPAGIPVGGGQLMKANSMSDLLDLKEEEKGTLVVRPAPKPPAPPPPPPTAPTAPSLPPSFFGKGVSKGGVKLKQVHWTPVEKKQVSVSLWSEGKSHLPTFDIKLLEDMFSVTDREGTVFKQSKAIKETLVDSKRAQNLGILFSGFKADTLSQVLDALSSVTELDSFQLQKMTTLKRFQPSAEDKEMFRMYRQSRDSLTPVDRFMLDLCEIPKLSMRIDLTLALWDLPNSFEALLEEVEELLSACEVLLSNSRLPVVLRCLLAIGNHLNAKRQSKDVPGFQISSIDKMVDLKGRDPQYSLMTYLVEQLSMSRPDLLDWTASMDLVPKVAGYSVRAIGAETDVLKNDLQKVKKYQKTLKGLSGVHKKFQSDVQNFVLEYEKRMHNILDKNDRLKHRFQQLLAWLGEPPSRTSDVLFSSLALLIERFNTARSRLAT